MKLFEISIPYHKELNPKLWDGLELKPDVRDALLDIAESFIEYLDVPFEPDDIILTGSGANYNWTEQSDVDLHLITSINDYKKTCPAFAEDFFSSKKTLWNDNHDITVHDLPVEIYVQDKDEAHFSTGVYSVKDSKWITKPEYAPPKNVDEDEVEEIADEWKERIDAVISKSENPEEAVEVKDELRDYRKKGLEADGEFSVPNLVFKELRRSGHIGRLIDHIHDAKSEELSLD